MPPVLCPLPMVAVLITLVFGGVLLWLLGSIGALRGKAPLAKLVMAGYAIRVILQFFIRNLDFFTSGGVDSAIYEGFGRTIAASWRMNGIHFVTSEELPLIGATSLPPNLFALMTYVTDGENTRLASTALVALAAGIAAINIYTLALEFGAEEKHARLMTQLFYFQPAFLFYTCDTYKDGLVVAIVLGAIGSALRLSKKFTVVQVLVCIGSLWALWHVRFYLIFISLAPLGVGLSGFGGKRLIRPLLATFALVLTIVAVAAYTDVLQLAAERAAETFEIATQESTLGANSGAMAGSGVVFDDGGVAYNALPQKLAYTLLSPFFWVGGSAAFHIGKIDGFVWYFIMYRAAKAARQVDRVFVLMLATFLVPCTLMYAMSMSNVGLIVRQRLPIVAITAVLAALYRQKSAVRVVAPPKAARPQPKRTTLPRRRGAAAAHG